MNLISVYKRPDRYEILFKLLAERDEMVNISHRGMPNWCDHIKFVDSKPYEAWYFMDNEPFGACYLSKQNEIGVFVFKEHQGNGYGRAAIEALIKLHGPRRYLANVAPANTKSSELFGKLGFRLIQHTYEVNA